MDEATWADWQRHAERWYLKTRFSQQNVRWRNLLDHLKARLPADFEKWDANTTSLLADKADLSDRLGAKAVRSVRLGYASATGDHSILSPHDRMLMGLDGHQGSGGSVTRIRDGEYSVKAKVACAVQKGLATVARTTTQQIAVGVLDAEAAPIVGSLPFAHGTESMPIRMHEGTYLRPIYGPLWKGEFRPVDLETFAECCLGHDAWFDNPFMQPRPNVDLAVDDVAIGGVTRKEANKAAAAAGELLAKLGPLYVVDGVVHRRTSEPKLHVVKCHKVHPSGLSASEEEHVALLWSCDGIEANLTTDPVKHSVPFELDYYFGYERDLQRGKLSRAMTFPVGMHALAHDVAKRLAELCEIPLRSKPVTWVEADRSDAFDAFDRLETFASALKLDRSLIPAPLPEVGPETKASEFERAVSALGNRILRADLRQPFLAACAAVSARLETLAKAMPDEDETSEMLMSFR